MTAVSCVVCQADTDANLCTRCTRELEQAIAELPALLAELEVTTTRQDRGTGTALYAMRRTKLQIPGVHYAEGTTTLPATPWPFSWDAANLAWTVRNSLGTWARHIADIRGLQIDMPPTLAGPVHAWCMHESCAQIRDGHRRDVRTTAWLLRNITAIRLDEAAGEIHQAITGDRLDIERAIDRQDPDIYAGRCDATDVRTDLEAGLIRAVVGTCGAELYARLGDDEVKCGACGQVYDLAARKQYLAERVDDEWARPHVIANALTSLDEPVRPDTLRKWIERDAELVEQGRPARYPLILQVGVDDGGHALYRVGDVRARITAMRERRMTA